MNFRGHLNFFITRKTLHILKRAKSILSWILKQNNEFMFVRNDIEDFIGVTNIV